MGTRNKVQRKMKNYSLKISYAKRHIEDNGHTTMIYEKAL